MDVYIGEERKEGIVKKGITVYDESGQEVYGATKQYREEGAGKFDATLRSLTWGIRQFRKLEELGEIDVTGGKVCVYTKNKVVFGWVRDGKSPKRYTESFSELMVELSSMSVETELHRSDESKVLYLDEEEEMSRVVDILGYFDVE